MAGRHAAFRCPWRRGGGAKRGARERLRGHGDGHRRGQHGQSRYTIGFFHPKLDSLGLAAPLSEVAGRYVSATDIARRQPRSVSELLRGVPGIKLERFGTYVDTTAIDTSGTGTNPLGFTTDATRILMRATVKDWCFPTFFIDGHQVNSLSAEEVDTWVRPEQILGVEAYRAETVPPQFAMPLANCGSILIWRK